MEPPKLNILSIQKTLMAKRKEIMNALGLSNTIAPGPFPSKKKRKTVKKKRTVSRFTELQYATAKTRAEKRHSKAVATGKLRKRLGANARLLEEAGVLPDRLKYGAPLVRVEGNLPKL